MQTDPDLGNLFDNGHWNSASQALPIRIFFDTGSHILVNVTWCNTKTDAFVCVSVCVLATFSFLIVSLNDVKCWDFVASVDEHTRMEHWWLDIDRVNKIFLEKPTTIALCPVQIPYGPAWEWTPASAVKGRLLNGGGRGGGRSGVTQESGLQRGNIVV